MGGSLHEEITVKQAVKPATYAAAANTLGIEIDARGYDEAEFVINTGDFTATGTVIFAVHEASSSGGTYTAVASSTQPATGTIGTAADSAPYLIRVDLAKRAGFLKLAYDVDTDSATFGAVCLLRRKKEEPVAQDKTAIAV